MSFLDVLEHLNEGCWNECKQSGPCTWCGPTFMCCSKNYGANGCDLKIGGDDYHRCALPGLVMYGTNYRYQYLVKLANISLKISFILPIKYLQ